MEGPLDDLLVGGTCPPPVSASSAMDVNRTAPQPSSTGPCLLEPAGPIATDGLQQHPGSGVVLQAGEEAAQQQCSRLRGGALQSKPDHLLVLSQQVSSLAHQGSSQRLHQLLLIVIEQYEQVLQQLAAATSGTPSCPADDTQMTAELQQQLQSAQAQSAELQTAHRQLLASHEQAQLKVVELTQQLEEAVTAQSALEADVALLQEKLLTQESELTHLRLVSLGGSRRPSTPGGPLLASSSSSPAPGSLPGGDSRIMTPLPHSGLSPEPRTPLNPAESQVAQLRSWLDQTQKELLTQQEEVMEREREVRQLQQELEQQASTIQQLQAALEGASAGAGAAAAAGAQQPLAGHRSADQQNEQRSLAQQDQEQLQELHQRLAAAEAAADAAQGTFAAARAAQEVAEQQQAAAEQQVSQLQQQREAASSELTAAAEQRQQLERQLQQALAAKAAAEAQCSEVQQQVAQLEQQLEEFQAQVLNLQQQQQEQVTHLQQHLAELHHQLQQTGRDDSSAAKAAEASQAMAPATPGPERHSAAGSASGASTARSLSAAVDELRMAQLSDQASNGNLGSDSSSGLSRMLEQSRADALKQELSETQQQLRQLLKLLHRAAAAKAAAAAGNGTLEGPLGWAGDMGPLLLLADVLQVRYCGPAAQQRLRLAGKQVGCLLEAALQQVKLLREEEGPGAAAVVTAAAVSIGLPSPEGKDTSPQADVWPLTTTGAATAATAAAGGGAAPGCSASNGSANGSNVAKETPLSGRMDSSWAADWSPAAMGLSSTKQQLHATPEKQAPEQPQSQPRMSYGGQESAGEALGLGGLEDAWWNKPTVSEPVMELPDFLVKR